MAHSDPIDSIIGFLRAVEEDYRDWDTDQRPWFRGEPGGKDAQPLLPTLYREEHDENNLLQSFRMRGPAILDLPNIPPRGEIDLWLFLARHMGLPTRLLDWTEGALIALWFALQEEHPVVWMLNPLELNRNPLGVSPDNFDQVYAGEPVPNEPTLTWAEPPEGVINIYRRNIKAAWELETEALPLPVAVQPTHIHGLMSAQHSCFTVHGSQPVGLAELVGEECLRRYEIEVGDEEREQALLQLRRFGVSRTVVFPSGQGLAEDLRESF